MSTSHYPHIELNLDCVPFISGKTIKVLEIVQDHLAHHWNADDLHRQYPQLTLAEIHAALTYGQTIRELELIAKALEPQEIRNRIVFLPL